MTDFPKKPIIFFTFSFEIFTAFYKSGVMTLRHSNGDFYKEYPMSSNEADSFFMNITVIA